VVPPRPPPPPPHTHTHSALALLAGATAVFNQYCAIRVMKARKAEGVAFPTLYAAGDSPSAVRFNCVQRGHQQFLENLPITALLVGLIAQLAPRLAVGLAATWLAGRVIYFNGYAAGDPKGRVPGAAVSALAQLVMMVTAVVWGAKTLVVGA
jgi:glutathione S-transferase